jgi:hypothetical protein
MEAVLLSTLVVILIILTVVIIMLARSVIRIRQLEEDALVRAEASTQTPSGLIPQHLQQGFEEIAARQQKHFDTLLHTTVTSFDKQLYLTLEFHQKKQMQEFNKQFDAVSAKLRRELKKMTEHSIKESGVQLTALNDQTQKINKLMQERLEHHFSEIAWQYIAISLQESVDLHSQKDAIFEQLKKHQTELAKDFNAH